MTTVRGATVVVETGVLRYHGGEDAFIDVSSGEIGVPEVARLIGIVKFKTQRLGERVIYPTVSRDV